MNKYDLEKRCLDFAIKLLKILTSLHKNPYNYKLICQCISSGTSIGANYMEANGAESRKDFVHKISLSLKEAKETKFWLECLQITNPESKSDLMDLWNEANEFTLIFGKITKTCNQKI